jgi:glycosyltransferase involved in cell wall biosynthesis
MARISVIIPTYNRAHCLATAIDSVLRQTFTDLEVIIVDDGSTDETRMIVQRYLCPTNDRQQSVRYIKQSHRGKSVALNNVLQYVHSEWIAFLDSDDEWLPGKLEQQFRALERFPGVTVCFTDYVCINNPKMETTGFNFCEKSFTNRYELLHNTAAAILEAPFVSMVTLICRSELVGEVGGFDPGLHFTEDYDFIFRLALGRDFCFVNLPLVKVDRSVPAVRHTGTSAIWDNIDFRLSCERYRYEKWLSMGNMLSSPIRKTLARKLGAVHSSWANEYLQRGDYDHAIESIDRAVGYRVTLSLIVKRVVATFFPTVAKSLTLRRGFKTEHF